jgi:hypothetical protein
MTDKAYDAVMPAKANADKTDEADKANKADELISRGGLADDVNDAEVAEANDAEEAKATDADKADEANFPNEATDADKVDKANLPDKAVDASETNEVEATEADKADAIVLFFIIANIVIIILGSLLDKGIVIILYSLTKYSAVFAKRKGYFGIMMSNNQRGCFLEIWNDYQRNKIDATINLDV